MAASATYTDWRGAEIHPGDQVIYYGQNMGWAMGIVNGFTKNGNVRIDLMHRSEGRGGNEKHSVPPNRITVLLGLPDTTLRSVHEVNEEARKREEERDRNYASHVLRPYPQQPTTDDFKFPDGHTVPIISSFGWARRVDFDEAAYNAAMFVYHAKQQDVRQHRCSSCRMPEFDLRNKMCPVVTGANRV